MLKIQLQVLADSLHADNTHHLQRSKSCLSTNGNQDGIFVKNLIDGESLSYSLALIRGKAPLVSTYIRVRGSHKNQSAEWPVVNGEFRVLVELQRGVNKLELEAGGFKSKLSLVYEPRSTRFRVTPVYVICAGHDGYFQVIFQFLLFTNL